MPRDSHPSSRGRASGAAGTLDTLRRPRPSAVRTQTPPPRRVSVPTSRAAGATGARRRVAGADLAAVPNPGFVGLIGLVGLLVIIGLVMVLSASSDQAIRHARSPWAYFERQVLWVVVGSAALTCTALVDYRRWRRWSIPALAGVTGLLVLVLVPGIGLVVNGSRRWLGFGSWRIQPSEMAKLAVVLFGADLLTRRADRMRDTRFTFRPLAILVVVLGALVMQQPDMGTTIIICSIAAAVLFVAGTPTRTLVVAGLAGIAGGGLLAVMAPYRLHRLLSFLHPERDAGNTGYQSVQGRVGMATGRWLGVGLGASREKTGYLPNAHTDFIFAVIGEEVGFVGCVVVVGLVVAFAVRGIRTAVRAPDRFGTLVATGITAWIVVQALVNVGAVVGLLPVTGVPLPFVSFGGSSMLIAMGAVGILANVARQGR
ncbi:MAG: stage V sporulation protein E [Acidimicrobiales bacterium]